MFQNGGQMQLLSAALIKIILPYIRLGDRRMLSLQYKSNESIFVAIWKVDRKIHLLLQLLIGVPFVVAVIETEWAF